MTAYQNEHTVGLKQEQIEAAFIDSKEYIGRFGSVGKVWVDGIYQVSLPKTPSRPLAPNFRRPKEVVGKVGEQAVGQGAAGPVRLGNCSWAQ